MCHSCVTWIKKAEEAGVKKKDIEDFLWEFTAFPLEVPSEEQLAALIKAKA